MCWCWSDWGVGLLLIWLEDGLSWAGQYDEGGEWEPGVMMR